MKILDTVKRLPRRSLAVSLLTLLSLCLLVPATAMAASSSGTPTAQQKCGDTDVKCVIAFGDQRITMRLDALTKLNGKVTTQQTAHHITDDQANVLHADVKTNSAGLTALKAKLDAETNAQAARQDVKNIYEQFRIYAVVLPRDYRQLHVDIEQMLLHKLGDRATRIQQVIAKAPQSKQAQLTTLFNDYTASLKAAEGQIDIAQATIPALTPANFNTNRTSYEASLNKLKAAEQAAHTDLHKAGDDLHQIAQLLKQK